MKKGDFVVIGWCGVGTYLLEIDEITKTALVASNYATYNKKEKAHGKPLGSYAFRWDSVNYVEATTENFDTRREVVIELNDEYTAVISKDRQTVTVGCQELPRAVVLKVAAALT